MTIHAEHPFRDPDPDPVRQFRGRLGGAVTLWTSGESSDVGDSRAGLTVSSLMVAHGEPARVLALIDPDSDLSDVLESSGCAVVHLLAWRHRDLAEAFAGAAPAPGGLFRQAEFEQTTWGPRLLGADSWAGVRLESTVEVGWSTQVTCVVEQVMLVEEDEPLVHRRGRYLPPAGNPR